MTHTPSTDPSPETPGAQQAPLHPSDILLNLIVAYLAPMFLCASNNDIRLARIAALETVNAYRARNHADLVSIAQIIGFGLAALASLSLSMADDLSISMTLRLRGNANACNRSAEQNRRALARTRAEAQETHRTDAQDANTHAIQPGREPAEPPTSAQLARHPHANQPDTAAQRPAVTAAAGEAPNPAIPMTLDQQRQVMWGAAAANVAAEITASLPTLPPAQRKAAAMRARALTHGANDLLSGTAPLTLSPGALANLMPTATL